MDTSGPAVPAQAAAERHGPPFAAPGARPLPWLLAWLPIAGLGLLALQGALGLGAAWMMAALIGALSLLGLTMFAGIRELRLAEARTHAALARAEAAEAAEHARAEELAVQLSETQRIQQQMVQASRLAAVGELAAAVAHEVNNPLTGILGFSDLLLAGMERNDPRRADLTVIHSEAVRARGIVRALLDFARPRPPQRVRIEPDTLVRSAVDLVRFRAHERRVTITESYGNVPTLELDPNAMKQVLLNLISNAFEAMPDGGGLGIATVLSGQKVGLRVADNGVGMDDATRSRIFTPFFTTRAGAAGGTGLGLSVGLRTVEGHGGSIEVESEAGRGSTFTVWLPLPEPAFRGATIVPAAEPSHSTDGGAAPRGAAA